MSGAFDLLVVVLRTVAATAAVVVPCRLAWRFVFRRMPYWNQPARHPWNAGFLLGVGVTVIHLALRVPSSPAHAAVTFALMVLGTAGLLLLERALWPHPLWVPGPTKAGP